MKYALTFLANIVLALLLVGCDNSVRNNVGALPPIDISGRLMVGPVRYAKIQLVGVDQYGQPQKIDADNYYGDVHYTDENGDFSAQIQGAYTGALMAIASSAEYTVTLQAATNTTSAVTEVRKTEIRCTLPNGCLNKDKAPVSYGAWFEAEDDFELRAVVPDVQGAENGLNINVSFLTDLAAKLAHVEYISNGSGSCVGELEGECPVSAKVDGILTPQAIFEANTRVKKQFFLEPDQPISIRPWSVFTSVLSGDSVQALAQTYHGVSAVQLLQHSKAESLTLMGALADLESVYLSATNQGQLLGEDDGGTVWDFESYYQNMVDYIAEISPNVDDSAYLSQVQSAVSLSLAQAKGDASLSEFQGGEYLVSLADKIAGAKKMVADVQGWAFDLSQTGTGASQYESFFDAGFADDLIRMEEKLEVLKKTLSPNLQSFFVPMVEFSEYALLCVRSTTGACSSSSLDSGPWQSFSAGSPSYTSSGQSLYLNKQAAYPKYFMSGRFDEADSNSLKRRFYFDKDIVVETDKGRVEIKADDGVAPSLTLSYTVALDGSALPDISRIELNIPSMIIRSKDESGALQTLRFTAKDVLVDLLGVKDATKPDMPRHFNIAVLDFPGQLQDGTSDNAEKFDVGLNLIANRPGQYYSPNMFPDLDVAIDMDEFKNYAQFSELDPTKTQLAGFLTMPSDVSLNEPLVDGVTYSEKPYSALDAALKELLLLEGVSGFEFASLEYAGGEDAFMLWPDPDNKAVFKARQCTRVDNAWGCFEEQPLSELGCDESFAQDTATISQVFSFLQNENCISAVRINGRGSYDIDYGGANFIDGSNFSASLNAPYYLGLKSFSLRLVSRFVDDATGEQQPTALLNVLGGIYDTIGIQGAERKVDASVAVSLTHNYIGFSNSESAGLYEIVPYGDRTLWFAMGQDSTVDNSALIYYIQDGSYEMVMSGFDETLNHDESLGAIGYIRFEASLLGTLRKEGDLYVIRYADGTWQLL